MGRSLSGRSHLFDSPPCPIGTASYGDRGRDKVGRPNAHNRRAEEQKEDGGRCVLFSAEDRGRKGKGRIPHKA